MLHRIVFGGWNDADVCGWPLEFAKIESAKTEGAKTEGAETEGAETEGAETELARNGRLGTSHYRLGRCKRLRCDDVRTSPRRCRTQ